jgi:hypothetical protein
MCSRRQSGESMAPTLAAGRGTSSPTPGVREHPCLTRRFAIGENRVGADEELICAAP